MLCGRSVLWWGGVWHASWIFIGTSLPHTLKDQQNTWLQEDKNPWCLCLFSTLIQCVHVMRFLNLTLPLIFCRCSDPLDRMTQLLSDEKSKLFNWIPPSHDLLIRSAVYQTHLLQPPPPQNCYHLNPHLTRHGFTSHHPVWPTPQSSPSSPTRLSSTLFTAKSVIHWFSSRAWFLGWETMSLVIA